MNNPFSVRTPEEITATDAHTLFVDNLSDFPKLLDPGHMFIHGPRGSGKSMMFRYMKPDCQVLYRASALKELAFFGVYCPIRNTNLSLTELLRLKTHYADVVLNEHFMVAYFMERVSDALRGTDFAEADLSATKLFLENCFAKRLRRCGWRGELPIADCGTVQQCFSRMFEVCEDLYAEVMGFIRHLSTGHIPDYKGPLCGYLDFLHPVIKELKSLPFLPAGPVFLMIDDADNLNLSQTLVLNSWVATRTSSDVSLKISTQLGYKTYRTISGQYIDRTHDYTEVYIDALYTTNKSKYRDRVREVIQKRLALVGISATPEEFFPEDEAQEAAIKKREEDLIARHAAEGRGNRPGDDALRYARPEYIASLKGPSKSGASYSYAGFSQLVHLSSALIRYFLEPAALMFSRQKGDSGAVPVQFIKPHIQDEVVRKESDNLLFEEMDKLASEKDQENEYYIKVRKLSNLIHNLGGVFHLKLISSQSERRVFSIALSDPPDTEIGAVLALGVQQGYLQKASLGNKDGTGRTHRYILTRRLAPSFLLDPSGFSGYMFVTNKYLHDAMDDPKTLRRIKGKGVDLSFADEQPELDLDSAL